MSFIPLAYIDPMSGAVVLQLLLAFIAGGVAFFRNTIIGGIRRTFGGGVKEKNVSE